jgi:hypothetical protein
MKQSITDELLAEIINNLTIKDILEASAKVLRKEIYKEFPTANPQSIELAILIFQEYMREIYADTGFIEDGLFINLPTGLDDQKIQELTEKAKTLGTAIRVAIKKMNS